MTDQRADAARRTKDELLQLVANAALSSGGAPGSHKRLMETLDALIERKIKDYHNDHT